jgi:transposase
MGEVSTIGLDIAKSVFQIHGVGAGGAVVIRKRISRAKLLEFFASLPACLVGIEACPTAHYWGRRLQALGHTVKLMPPSYVKAYLKRSKNDANDAAAICEAVTRPSMRFVATKSEQQQCGLMLHRSRQLLVCQRTANFCRDARCGTRPGKFNDGGKSGGLLPIIDEGHGERLHLRPLLLHSLRRPVRGSSTRHRSDCGMHPQ